MILRAHLNCNRLLSIRLLICPRVHLLSAGRFDDKSTIYRNNNTNTNYTAINNPRMVYLVRAFIDGVV